MDLYQEEQEQANTSTDRRFMGRLAGGVEEPHLKDYIRVLLMRRWVVIGISLLVIFTTALIVFLMTPIYQATCLLLIEPTKIKITNFQDVYDPTLSQFAGSELSRREFMETQSQLLTCRSVMERVFADFNFSHPCLTTLVFSWFKCTCRTSPLWRFSACFTASILSFVTTAVTAGPFPHKPAAFAPAAKASNAIEVSYPKAAEYTKPLSDNAGKKLPAKVSL